MAIIQVSTVQTLGVALPAPATAGSQLVLIVWSRDVSGSIPDPGLGGWDEIGQALLNIGFARATGIWGRVATADETGVTVGGDGVTYDISGMGAGMIVELDELYAGVVSVRDNGTGSSHSAGGSVSPPTADPSYIIGTAGIGWSDLSDPGAGTPDSGVTELNDSWSGQSPRRWAGYRTVSSTSPTDVGGDIPSTAYGDEAWAGVTAVFSGEGIPPDPDPDPEGPHEPPETEDVGALLEIWVAEEGAALWDVALWDDVTWSTSAWTDITYLGVVADVSWGVDNAERGILAPTVAGVWQIDTHDPDRILDPANADSPYATELVPGLPIRISVAGRRVLRTGVVDTMLYSHAKRGGRIRATDNIARMAGADVSESDLGVLPDNLYARSVAAIAAAGLDVQVSPVPSTGDPFLAAWDVSGDASVWDVIAQSALETLRMPYLNEHGVLYFRRWALPLERGIEIASPELVDLTSFVSFEGLFSAVRVNDATAMDEIELAITPPPAYGRRVHERSAPTILGETWAETVLADRSVASLRWRPGQIRPLTAERVVQIGSISHNEAVTLYVPEADPDVEVRSRVLGVNVRVIDLGGRRNPDGSITPNTQWRFNLLATTAAVEPLVDDDDLVTFLVDDDDGVSLLYPDGVAFTEV